MGKITCSKCGSIYSLKVEKVPYRDKDTLECIVCENEIYSWNEAKTYYADLIEKKENHLTN